MEVPSQTDLQQYAHDYTKILQEYVEEYDIAHLLQAPIDHCAIKTANTESYEAMIKNIAELCSELSYIHLNDRRIATAVLNQPLVFGTLGEVALLEIMEPKPGKTIQTVDCIEHIEILYPDLQEVIKPLDVHFVSYEDSGNEYHRTIVVHLNPLGQEIKFTDTSLAGVLEQQENDGKVVHVK